MKKLFTRSFVVFVLATALSISAIPAKASSLNTGSTNSLQHISSARDSTNSLDLKKKKKKKKKTNPCRSISYDQIDIDHSSWYTRVINYSQKCDIKFKIVVSRCEAEESLDCNLNIYDEYDIVIAWVSKNSSVELNESYGRTNIGGWDGYFYDFDLEILAISK